VHPVCIQIGDFKIHWFGVMMALGFLAGLLNWTWLGRRENRGFNACSDLLLWIMISGILGARAAYVLSDLPSFLAAPLTVFRIDQGGLIYYGGFVGAAVALVIYARRHGENVWSVFDFVITAVPLAHALGRIGCFLNGCCYGALYDGALAVRFPEGSLPWWHHVREQLITRYDASSLPVHPAQLYAVAANLVIYAVLVLVYRRRPGAGVTAALYVVLYAPTRFVLEFLRGDQRIALGVPLDAAQIMSLVSFLIGAVLLALRLRAAGPRAAAAES